MTDCSKKYLWRKISSVDTFFDEKILFFIQNGSHRRGNLPFPTKCAGRAADIFAKLAAEVFHVVVAAAL